MMASPLPVRCESEKALTNKIKRRARVVSIVTQLKLTTRDGVVDTFVLDLRIHFIDDPGLICLVRPKTPAHLPKYEFY